jgi:hypothetical protein
MKKSIKNFIKLLGIFFICTASLSAYSKSYNSGIAVKFFGLGTAGKLSTSITKAIINSNIDVTGFDCYQLPILDPATSIKRGIGVDCLRPISASGDTRGEGLQLEAITFFFFKEGTLVNHGCTSVRPFFEGIGDSGVTHMTGSIGFSEFGVAANINAPDVCKTSQGIIFSSGAFRRITGEARLSGAVDLKNASNGEIRFSCLFVLSLSKQKHS